jgi:hypothetical protein
MERCWDVNPDKRPEMTEVVSMLEAVDTSKGGGMIPVDYGNLLELRSEEWPLDLVDVDCICFLGKQTG